jgi:TolB-like protein
MNKLIALSVLFLFAVLGAFADKALDAEVKKAFDEIDYDTQIYKAKGRQAGETKFAVLDFETPKQDLSRGITIDLETAITQNKNYTVVERGKINTIRQEKHDQADSGEVSDSEMARIGVELGANVIITGSIIRVGSIYKFNARAVDVETARLLTSYTHNFKKTDDDDLYVAFGDDKADAEAKAIAAQAKQKKAKARTTFLIMGGRGLASWLFALSPYGDFGAVTPDRSFSNMGFGFGGYVGFYNSTAASGFEVHLDYLLKNHIRAEVSGQFADFEYKSLDLALLYKLGSKGANFVIGVYGSMPTGSLTISDDVSTTYDIVKTAAIFGTFGAEAGLNIGFKLGPGQLMLNGTFIYDFTKLKVKSGSRDVKLFNRMGLLFFAGYEFSF